MPENETGRKSLKMEGRNKFERAYFKAFLAELTDLMQQKPVHLLSFDEMKSRLRLTEQTYKGLEDIPLDRIVGSVGRYKDFTRKFLPKNISMVERWSNVYAQMNSLEGVPPIDVFQVDDVYFVRDGNHRVSIAREMGLTSIEAHVTLLHTPIDLEPDMSQKELEAAAAYGAFLNDTRLDMLRPQQEHITLTEPANYDDLRSHIWMVQQMMEHERKHPVPFDEAACQWYDTMYMPTVELIRKYKVLRQFPKRTEADMYCWVIRHFEKLSHIYGGPDKTRISEALVAFLAENNIPVPKRLLLEDDEPPKAHDE